MAGKTPGSTRKSTSGRKASAKKASTVTPIDQNVPQSQNSSQGHETLQNQDSLENQNLLRNQNEIKGLQTQSLQTQDSSQNGNMDVATGAANREMAARPAEPAMIRPAETSIRTAGPELVEQIRARAYELFEQRGRLEGYDQQDWTQAEAEILAKFQREKSA
jgi:Protein of unknown function (DUF2934)